MRVAVIGGGAMGGMFAARIARAGGDVIVVDAADEVTRAISERGIEVSAGGQTTTTKVAATGSIREARDASAAIVFVKAHHTPAVAEQLRSCVHPGMTVVSLQNGWGNADVLARTVAATQLVIGVTYHSCTVLGPGQVAHTGTGPTVVGPLREGGDMERAERIAALLTSAGLDAAATADVRTEIWKKLILNAATLPVAAVTRLRAGEMADGGEVQALVDALAGEAVAVAGVLGLKIDLGERTDRIHAVLAGAGQGKPSMLQDVEAQRKTEIEVVNAAVVAAAHEAGVSVPVNEAMVALVHGVERSWAR